MAVAINSPAIISTQWIQFKSHVANKELLMQYDDDGYVYTLFAFDGPIAYLATIWKNGVPDGITANSYSQAQNDVDRSDFETNYQPTANKPLSDTDAIRRKMSEVNFRKDGIANDTYFMLIDQS